jgi:WD40 repeat protein/serine/threonine protein kinase
MAKVYVLCTNESCKARYSIDDSLLGKKAKCKHCGTLFPLTASQAAPPAPQAAQRSATPLPVSRASGSVPPGTAAAPRKEKSAGVGEWRPGDVILDLYEVRGVLGEGGMGKVYQVHHKGWNADLALKSPRPEILTRAGAAENFERECETWINLGLHPHTVSCYYVRRIDDIPRVFAEYIDGGSLKDWIDKGRLYEGGPASALERILDVAIQFAWGLHHAHEQGLIHQDVKPANVMLTADGTAKVTDFGLAKARALAGEAAAPAGGQQSILVSAGGMTPAYCSPEQANYAKLTRKTDIWSWAVSILEMFTGDVTWGSGAAAGEALEGYLEMGSGDERLPLMPAPLATLLRQCLQHEPAARPADFRTIAQRLQEVYREVIGRPHLRSEGVAVQALADSLNNRAMSLVDLGQGPEAEKLLEEARHHDLHHPEVTYNLGLLKWRRASVTDDQVVEELELVCAAHLDRWQPYYYLGLVHLERDDLDAAVKVLEEATRLAPTETQVAAALEAARVGRPNGSRSVRRFGGHDQCVNSVVFSPDGRWALSGSEDETILLWEVATGQCLRIRHGHELMVTSVCFSPDGRQALSGSDDHTLRLWELASGDCKRMFIGHTSHVRAVCFSPDGRLALSGSRGSPGDESIRLWDVATGKCLRGLQGHAEDVFAVCFSPDGRRAVSGSEDKTIRLWDVATGECLRTFEGHEDKVNAVAFSPDGQLVLSASGWIEQGDNTVRLWEVNTGKCVRTIKGHENGVTSACFSADGRRILSGSEDQTLRLWDVATSGWKRVRQALGGSETTPCLKVFTGHKEDVRGVALSPDGRLALSGSKDGTTRLWDVETGQCVRNFGGGRLVTIHSVCASPDGHTVLTASSHSFEGEEGVRLWDALTGVCLRSFAGHTARVYSACFSPDGKSALSGSEDKTLRLWDIATGKCLRSFEGHTSDIHSVCFSPDAKWALSGSNDKTVRLWEVATGKCLRSFEGHTGRVRSVCFSPNGRTALSACWDKTVRLWDAATGRCTHTLEGHLGVVHSACFSPDGRSILSASQDKTMRLWDVAKGCLLRTFEGHKEGVQAACFSPDGKWILSVNAHSLYEQSIRLWEVSTGRCLRSFRADMRADMTVAFRPDGRGAFSSAGSHLWSWQLGDLGRHQAPAMITRPVAAKEALAQRQQFNQALTTAKQALIDAAGATAALEALTTARSVPGFQHAPAALELAGRLAQRAVRRRLRGAWQHWASAWSAPILHAGFSPDGRWILSVDDSGDTEHSVQLRDTTSGQAVRTWGAQGSIRAACFSPDGQWVLSGGSSLFHDVDIYLWAVATGSRVKSLTVGVEGTSDDTYKVEGVGFSPDGRFAFAGARYDGRREHKRYDNKGAGVHVWDVATGKVIRSLRTGDVRKITFSPDGRFALAFTSHLHLYDLATGADLRQFKYEIPRQLNSIGFSPDGRWAVVGDGEGTCLWEVATARCVRTLGGQAEYYVSHSGVTSVCFSPDGRWILSGNADNTLGVWAVETGECVRKLEAHTDVPLSVCFSPDGRFALSGGQDKMLRLWEFDWELEVPQPQAWDEGALPYLEMSLALHGKPQQWEPEGFERLLQTLGRAGYGWLQPEGVRQQLEKVAAEWKAPPSLAGK